MATKSINGVNFYEDNNSCRLSGGRDTPMVGHRILRCAWADRVRAVTALLGKIVIRRDADGSETREVLFPPDTFPGWDNLEAAEFDIEPIGAPSEAVNGGADYTYARFTVDYKPVEYDQDASSDGNSNEGQFYDTEEIDYEDSYISVPGGTYTVGTTKSLDATLQVVPVAVRTYTKRNLASIPDFMDYVGKVNDDVFPPNRINPAAQACLMLKGAKTTRKVDAQGNVRYDVRFIFKERYQSWNAGIDPATGKWAAIAPVPFTEIDFRPLGKM
ncbi:MAG: hypothetical protein KJ556_22010 [Gammaproteobacteria bacterium]|nr:hypothetical protein [Gammaproteobacteria bacterium]